MADTPSEPTRPTIAAHNDLQAATAAVAGFVAQLQNGWDRHDAAIADAHFSADLAWGSPYGATLHGFDRLYAIHERLFQQGIGGPSSRYEIKHVLPISEDVVVAHVARLALDAAGQPIAPTTQTDSAFSEMALYVLVRRDDTWWLAAGQNTPIRAGGAV
jgi:uncharacterized protein (TIGR02246 family)